MGACPHGINLNKECRDCEKIAAPSLALMEEAMDRIQERRKFPTGGLSTTPPKGRDEEPMLDFYEIDLHRLHEEWETQPKLYRHFAEQLADARRDLEQARTDRDVVEAEVEMDIRKRPEQYGLEKVTEGAVKSLVLLQKRFRAAIAEAIEAKHKADVLEAAVSTLEHRKKALENLVQLRLSDYFSEPRKPRSVQEAEADKAFNRKGKR